MALTCDALGPRLDDRPAAAMRAAPREDLPFGPQAGTLALPPNYSRRAPPGRRDLPPVAAYSRSLSGSGGGCVAVGAGRGGRPGARPAKHFVRPRRHGTHRP
jgi:hypothetical protein